MASAARGQVAQPPSAVSDLGAGDATSPVPAEILAELPGFLVPYLQAVHASPVGELVRASSWVYPSLETVHMIGLGLLFGGIAALDLRLLGLNKSIAISHLSRHVLPWVWLGFVLNLVSGAMLFASDPVTLAANISFQLKMLAIVAAGLNAAVFQMFTVRGRSGWDAHAPAPAMAKLAAVLSLSAWLAVITLGRLIAYWA